jgi:ribose/xylose/arabinose/galactoside ABC-type transport system permease subunit
MLPALLLVILIGSVLSPSFATIQNFETVLKIAAIIGLISIGQTLVILSGGGGIDLSVGAVAAVAGVCGALVASHGLAAFVGVALLTGAYFGLVNGLGITRGLLQPFIVTLAIMTLARGAAFYISNGTPLIVDIPALEVIGSGYLWFVPIPIIIFAAAVLIAHVFLRHTVWGREIYAIGGTEDAAYLSGVPVRRRRMAVYITSGMLAGLTGVLLTAFTFTADANAAVGYELSAIAAVVVGGTLLSGGVGSVLGTAIGVLIIAFTGNILTLLNVNPFIQIMVNGLIVLLAVSLEARRKPGEVGRGRDRLVGLATVFGMLAVGAVAMVLFLRP